MERIIHHDATFRDGIRAYLKAHAYAFTEGWAQYCEQMLVDEGFGAEPSATHGSVAALTAAKYRRAQTDEAQLRICRLCVSIQMHCQDMTVAEAASFFQDNCYYEPGAAHSEAMRATFDPEYLYYTNGKRAILKPREDYRKQEGPNFSLDKCHDRLLNQGAPPIRPLPQLMLKVQRVVGRRPLINGELPTLLI